MHTNFKAFERFYANPRKLSTEIRQIKCVKKKMFGYLGKQEKLKINFVISFIIIITVFIISVVVGKYSILKLIKYSLYYLFYISLIEEILFRGFIQNYLFGLKCNKYLVFLIGALMFSIMHLPFQMYKNNNVSLTYIIEALPIHIRKV